MRRVGGVGGGGGEVVWVFVRKEMEGERGVPNYELQVSFSTPQAIHEMGFVQFEENQAVMSFLAPAQSSHQISQPVNTAASISNSTNSTAMGFSHNDQVYKGKIRFQTITKDEDKPFTSFNKDMGFCLLFC